MARIEFPEELRRKIDETGPVELVIGVTGAADAVKLREKAAACLQGSSAKTVVAHAGFGNGELVSTLGDTDNVQLVAYPMPADTGSLAFWADIVAAATTVMSLAVAWQARACVLIHTDLAALEPNSIRLLAEPVLEGRAELVMPIYPEGKNDGLINKGLLAPLSRALYGRRVRAPATLDLCVGANALASLVDEEQTQRGWQLPWPANTVAMGGGSICQACVPFGHAAQTDGFELSAVLGELTGSLFQQVETQAAFWQRVRGSQPVTRYGDAVIVNDHAQNIDPRSLVESFVIGSQNLEEVWRLVLPPGSVLELKRLTRLEPERFRMPDDLWARTVYDFALAYRMRRVSRSHVLGALTPLYLGWVASYVQEVSGVTALEADRRIEQLARVYEEQKPYFVSRWRWPERVS